MGEMKTGIRNQEPVTSGNPARADWSRGLSGAVSLDARQDRGAALCSPDELPPVRLVESVLRCGLPARRAGKPMRRA